MVTLARAQAGGVVQAVSDAYDFGSRSVLDQSPISHTFVLKAGAESAVVVDRLQPSCHCTRAVPVGGADGYGRFTVAAGKTASVLVTVNPGDMAPGAVEKEVYVFVNGGSTPGVTLHVRGTLAPPVAFSVPVLDFGAAVAGKTRTRPLTVTIDPRLLSPGQTARLVSSDPRLQVARLGSGEVSQTYEVTIPAAMPPGSFNAALSVALSPRQSALETWSISTRGEVQAPGRPSGRTNTLPAKH